VAASTERGPVLFTIDAPDSRPCRGLQIDDAPLAWSPDGGAIFFSRLQQVGTVEIHRLDLSTGREKLVWSLSVQDPAGVRNWMGAGVSRDGKYYAYSFARSLSDLYVVDGLK